MRVEKRKMRSSTAVQTVYNDTVGPRKEIVTGRLLLWDCWKDYLYEDNLQFSSVELFETRLIGSYAKILWAVTIYETFNGEYVYNKGFKYKFWNEADEVGEVLWKAIQLFFKKVLIA